MDADGAVHQFHPSASTNVSDFIVRIQGGVSPELGARILDIFGQSSLYEPAKSANYEVAKAARVSEQLNIAKVAMSLGTGPARGTSRMLANSMLDWMAEYVSQTNHAVELDRFSAPNLVRYHPGGFFSKHTDAMAGTHRTVSAVALLPSEFTGGEFRFFDDEPFALEPGDVVLFPSTFLFPHSVSQVLSGVRYSIVSWMA